MTVWYSSASADDRKRLDKIVRTASKIIGTDLPSLSSVHHTRTINKAMSIVSDPDHPAFSLFEKLPSNRRFRSIKTRTSRFHDSFYPTAVRAMSEGGEIISLTQEQ